jgi:uncharacterized coiled-coil protein SlyX
LKLSRLRFRLEKRVPEKSYMSIVSTRTSWGEMLSEEKAVSRTIAVALGMLCLGVMIGLVIVVWNENSIISNYNSLVNSKDEITSDLWSQVTDLQVQISSKNQQIANLSNQVAVKDAQIADKSAQTSDLQNKIAGLEAPQIINVDVKADDQRPPEWTEPHLYVHGHVFNAGTEWAYHVRLHVVAHQTGGVVAIDAYIERGDLWGRWWIEVDANMPYLGEPLIDWTITPEWAATA